MVKTDTVRSVLFVLAAGAVFGGSGRAETELYFPDVGGGARFALTHPSTGVADVEFSLIGLDGEPMPGPVNPVRYEIPPRGHFSMSAEDVFARSLDGVSAWVRVRSPVAGIGGVLFHSAPEAGLEGESAVTAWGDQVVPIPDGGAGSVRTLRAVNPTDEPAGLIVTIRSVTGASVAVTSDVLAPGAGREIDIDALAGRRSGPLTVRLNSNVSLAAEARIAAGGAESRIAGQAASGTSATRRVAPHVPLGNGFESTLLLANPTGQPVNVTVTLSAGSGEVIDPLRPGPIRRTLTVGSNATAVLDGAGLTGLPAAPAVNGWLAVDSPNVPLGAVLVVSRGASASAYALQAVEAGMRFFPYAPGTADEVSLALTNTGASDAAIELVFVDSRGGALSRARRVIPADSKRVIPPADLFPRATLRKPGWVGVVGAERVHGAAVFAGASGRSLSIVGALALPEATLFEPAPIRPYFTSVRPPVPAEPGSRLVFAVGGVNSDAVVLFGDRVVRPLFSPFGRVFVDVPADVEAGYVDIRLRSDRGVESEPVPILVGSLGDVSMLRDIRSRAFFHKLDVGPEGLRLDRPIAVPIRGARVEVYEESTNQTFAVARTDDAGRYRIPAPPAEGYAVRVLASDGVSGVRVADNTSTSGDATHFFSAALGAEPPAATVVTDAGRAAGAFNILDVMRRANRALETIDPELPIPAVTVYWSPMNTRRDGDRSTGAIGITYFDTASGNAYVLGDRQVDSDEYDDSVLVHEYAHLLADRFSRDDSMGGPHLAGDALDPRVAWSEAWANFFSAYVTGDSVYRDTFGVGGASVLEFDLEDDAIPGDAGGYRSEFAVHSLLWDLVDDGGGMDDDGVALGMDPVWRAFRAMSADAYVYAPTFLDRLVAVDGVNAGAVEELARSRMIDYRASGTPTVSNPFPRPISVDSPVTGELDSLSRGRSNLAQSAHLFAFDFAGGAISVRLDITGPGPAMNPAANDLDLFLMDANGRVLERSDLGLDGQAELISTDDLPSGRYVAEVRSYYTRAETGVVVHNSGAYELTVLMP